MRKEPQSVVSWTFYPSCISSEQLPGIIDNNYVIHVKLCETSLKAELLVKKEGLFRLELK